MTNERITEGSASQREPECVLPDSLLSALPILKIIHKWLAGLIQLTDEEQKDAGIDLSYQHSK